MCKALYRDVLHAGPGFSLRGRLRFGSYWGKVVLGKRARMLGSITFKFDDPTSPGTFEAGDDLVVDGDGILAPRGGHIHIADDCYIGPHVLLQSWRGGKILIGNHVMIARGVSFYGSNHISSRIDIPMKHQSEVGRGIVIEDDVWIGAHAIVLDGVHIGRGTIIAAGAVVNRDAPPNSVVAGVPAVVIRHRTDTSGSGQQFL